MYGLRSIFCIRLTRDGLSGFFFSSILLHIKPLLLAPPNYESRNSFSLVLIPSVFAADPRHNYKDKANNQP